MSWWQVSVFVTSCTISIDLNFYFCIIFKIVFQFQFQFKALTTVHQNWNVLKQLNIIWALRYLMDDKFQIVNSKYRFRLYNKYRQWSNFVVEGDERRCSQFWAKFGCSYKSVFWKSVKVYRIDPRGTNFWRKHLKSIVASILFFERRPLLLLLRLTIL